MQHHHEYEKIKGREGWRNVEDLTKNKKSRGGGSWKGHIYMVKFTRNCVSLSDHIYAIVHGQVGRCMKTTEAIEEYVGDEYTHGSDVWIEIENLQLPTIEDPPGDAKKDAKENVSKISDSMCQEESRDYIKTKRFIN